MPILSINLKNVNHDIKTQECKQQTTLHCAFEITNKQKCIYTTDVGRLGVGRI